MAFRVVGHEPIFAVPDVSQAAYHYGQLGFKIEFHDETYAFASMGSLVIHLVFDEGKHQTPALYIHVDDAARVAEEWRDAGFEMVGPEDFDYGKRECSHRDPSGNLLRIGSPIPT